jgi:hypothetical protein
MKRTGPTPRCTASSLEALEARIAPANILATVSGQTLNITGTDGDNTITLVSAGGPITISSTTDTVNGAASFTTPGNITDISIKMLKGMDSVRLTQDLLGPPIVLTGGLTIAGGDGPTTVALGHVFVGKNVVITAGNANGGTNSTSLSDVRVEGDVSINHGTGSTSTTIAPFVGGFSRIGGKLSITNGTGTDAILIRDTGIGGNVTVKNGKADLAGNAGTTEISNFFETSVRSVIRGNVSISYLDGISATTKLSDVEVFGNVTLAPGKANHSTSLDGEGVNLPVAIHGNLTIKGSGQNYFATGTGSKHTGLVLDGGLAIATSKGNDIVTLNKLTVSGATKIGLGDGFNSFTVDDSSFFGTFALTTGKDADSLFIDSGLGTSLPTFFGRPATISLGAGGDFAGFDGNTDAGQHVTVAFPLIVHHGAGMDTISNTPANENFLFGPTAIRWVV